MFTVNGRNNIKFGEEMKTYKKKLCIIGLHNASIYKSPFSRRVKELHKKMVNKQITTIFLLLFCISFVSAVTIYSGESITIELEKPYVYYSVVGNSSEVNLNVSQVGNNVTIIPDKYSLNDSFEIVFFDIEKETITVYQSSGSSTKWKTEYVDRNITEYVDKEVIKEVPGDTTEIEKIVTKTSLWTWILLTLLVLTIIYTIIRRLKDEN